MTFWGWVNDGCYIKFKKKKKKYKEKKRFGRKMGL